VTLGFGIPVTVHINLIQFPAVTVLLLSFAVKFGGVSILNFLIGVSVVWTVVALIGWYVAGVGNESTSSSLAASKNVKKKYIQFQFNIFSYSKKIKIHNSKI
jgi:hypothetical protein